MSDFRERTEEEREAARLERERRRAAREASARHRQPIVLDPVPPDDPGYAIPRARSAPDSPSAGEAPAHNAEPADPGLARQPAYDTREHAAQDTGEHTANDTGEHAAYDTGEHAAYDTSEHTASHTGEHTGGAFAPGNREAPAGTRRISGFAAPARRSSAQRPAPAGVPRPGRRRGIPRGGRRRRPDGSSPTGGPSARRRHSRVLRILSLLALVLVGAAIWFLGSLFQPFHGSGHGRVDVVIPPHSTVGQVGDLLARDGVISSSFFFKLRAELDSSELRAGKFHMQLGMSYGSALQVLTTPPPPVKTSNLTIAEGDTRQRVADLLSAQHISGDYLRETIRSPLLNPRAYGAPANLPSLEGFLFPSTYQLREPIRTKDLVTDQLKAFKQNFATVNLAYARNKHLTPFDVLTIASIVQGEAQTLHDMPLVASVIYNRLHDHMMLAMDSTTRYAVGNYTSPLTVSQLASPSPYNTRNHFGLPLGPINNPGMAAIRAAASPAKTNFLFFVAKPCGNGSSVFTASQTQFEQYVQQYQNARAAHGGRSPTHC